jgi:hydroxymethylpyrimidine kinase/phosphomethylpyrimidine kinase
MTAQPDTPGVARGKASGTALTIAGSDPSGGAGVQMDLKCFAAANVHGCSVLTAVTVQNTAGVRSANPLSPRLVREQLEAVYDDFSIGAVKTGMLHNAAIVRVVAEKLEKERTPLVVDPVLSATRGAPLARADLAGAIRKRLLPLALLAAPNIHEAEELAGVKIDGLESMKEACARLHGLGARNVLIKGGHLPGGNSSDLFYDGEFHILMGRRLDRDVHGTGCMLSAFIAGHLARGLCLAEAVLLAKARVTGAIRLATRPGKGRAVGTPLAGKG